MKPKDMEELAIWLDGAAAAFDAKNDQELAVKLGDASRYIRRAAQVTCGGGIIGCHGGPSCTSDHK